MFEHFGRLANDRRGNFAMMMAIGAVPLLLGAGVARDYASMSRIRSELQQAMDSAALAVARHGTKLSNDQAVEIAANFVTTNFDPKYTDLSVERVGTGVIVSAATRAPLAFGNLFGYDNWPIAASSSADIAYMSYEIALVLDTTGSMKGGKLSSMKDAVGGMVESMSAQVNDTDKLKYAVVPFANFVNVGPEYGPKFDDDGRIKPSTGAAWLDLKGVSEVPQLELVPGLSRFELFHNLGQEWKGCVETRVRSAGGDHDTADSPAVASDKASLFVPAFAIDEPKVGGYRNNYIVSNVDPFATNGPGKVAKLRKYGVPDSQIGGLLGLLGGIRGLLTGETAWADVDADMSGGKGPNSGCVTQPIMPLNSNYASIVSKVNSLQANGTTNIMEGVAWGTRVLTPGEPFGQGADKAKKQVDKIMIVLTDGANVFGNNDTKLGSDYASHGYLVDGRLGITTGDSNATNALMNARTLDACTSAKAAGIEVYTIRLEEPDKATGTMLQECATSAGHYFDAPSRSQLDEVFAKISERIVRVRISS